MGFFMQMLSLQGRMFCLMAVGLVCRRRGLIGEAGQKAMEDLLLNVILPFNIIASFLGEQRAEADFFQNCLLMVLASALIQLLAVYGGRLLFRRFPRDRRAVLSFGLICSNSSFIGLPVAQALFGSLGVMYGAFFQIPIRISMWTAGLALFTRAEGRDIWRKVLLHPCIVSVFLGTALMLLQVRLPAVVMDTVSSVSGCTTPISMLVIGAILSGAPMRSLFSGPILFFCLIRLAAIPGLVYLLMAPFGLEPILVSICILMTAMPAGGAVSILADQYGCDAVFASQMTFTSILFSIFTIPLVMLLVQQP